MVLKGERTEELRAVPLWLCNTVSRLPRGHPLKKLGRASPEMQNEDADEDSSPVHMDSYVTDQPPPSFQHAPRPDLPPNPNRPLYPQTPAAFDRFQPSASIHPTPSIHPTDSEL